MEQEDFDIWYSQQKSFYLENIKGTEDDPEFMAEVKSRRAEFNQLLGSAMTTPSDDDNLIELEHVTFETGSDQLTADSKYQLNDAIDFLKNNPEVSAMLLGHTDNTGEETVNMQLSRDRALAVKNYISAAGVDNSRLDSRGYGAQRPVVTNVTEDGRQRNRRTEFYIVKGRPSEPQFAGNLSK